jgi:prephenate dehydratase
MTTIAIQGELGAFSEEAARRFFAEAVEPIPCRSFAEVGEAVIDGRVDFGLLPIENSLAGSVVGSYDVLATPELTVVGEVVTPIHHCLLALPHADLEGISQVLSHPIALAQCQRFFQSHPRLEAVAFYDTAGAAKEITSRGDTSQAAIAGRAAAERYGLEILAADIEDRHDNQTRFLVVVNADNAGRPVPSAPPVSPETRKTSLLVETRNAPGTLVHLILPFSDRGFNLSKIESRPGPVPWSYRFFIEVEADARESTVMEAVEEAREHATLFRVLGTFPKWLAEPALAE